MKNISIVAVAVCLIVTVFVQCSGGENPETPVPQEDTLAVALGAPETAAYNSSPAGLDAICNCTKDPKAPQPKPIFPVDVSLESNENCENCQPCFNCYAWQLFISVNWTADLSSPGNPDESVPFTEFGSPGDIKPVVWETYKDAYDVFRSTPPDPWGDGQTETRTIAGQGATQPRKGKFSTHQSDNTWLVDQNGNIVYYEITMNEDEFNYISKNELYHQQGIFNAFKNPDGTENEQGINLPWGKSEYGDVGAIEIKASWMIVPSGQEEKYGKKYKLTVANVPAEAGSSETEKRTLAMIGLHIAKKTEMSPQWIWATFEHVDNAPELADIADNNLKEWYNLYNPALGDPGPAPNYLSPPNRMSDKDKQYDATQVVRYNPIRESATDVNNGVWAMIIEDNPKSVFQYYELVDVQWPRRPVDLTREGMNTQLAYGCPVPKFEANTTMETFVQHTGSGGGTSQVDTATCSAVPQTDLGKSSCIGCHAKVAITPQWEIAGATTNDAWWTDYSALFYKALKH